MKIDISNLIGDLVEATVKSLNKKEAEPLSEQFKIRAMEKGKPKKNTKGEDYYWYKNNLREVQTLVPC